MQGKKLLQLLAGRLAESRATQENPYLNGIRAHREFVLLAWPEVATGLWTPDCSGATGKVSHIMATGGALQQ